MKWVHEVKRPDGQIYRYYRRKGFRLKRLHGEPGTPEFDVELALAAGVKPAAIRSGRMVYIYFIQEMGTGFIKIGSSVDPEKRLRTLQTAWPGELRLLGCEATIGGNGQENRLHKRFSHLRGRGEWFRPDIDLLTYIANRSNVVVKFEPRGSEDADDSSRSARRKGRKSPADKSKTA